MKRKREPNDEELLIVASPDTDEEKKAVHDENPGEAAPSGEESEEAADTASEAPDAKAEERIKREIAELKEYFPAIGAESIPEEVWERVASGDSLAAAYALFFIKGVKEKTRVSRFNAENQRKAPPRVKNSSEGELYFTPDTVRAMSSDEVRKNYNAIISSMKKWKK